MSLPEPVEVSETTPTATLSPAQEVINSLTLDSLPVELTVEIIRHVACTADNLKDLYNVARACKRLRSIT